MRQFRAATSLKIEHSMKKQKMHYKNCKPVDAIASVKILNAASNIKAKHAGNLDCYLEAFSLHKS